MGKSWSSRVSEFLGVALLLAMLFSSRPASAQSAPAGKTVSPNQGADTLRARTLRMEQALSQLATENAGSGGMTAVALAVGAAYTGIGVFAALNTQEEPRDSVFRGLAVTESLVIGGIFLGVGFHGLLPGPTMDVHRLARFQHDVRAGRMSATRLAQYEGELYTGALGARISRRTTGWMYMGAALAGSGLIVLAATSDMRGAAKELTYGRRRVDAVMRHLRRPPLDQRIGA